MHQLSSNNPGDYNTFKLVLIKTYGRTLDQVQEELAYDLGRTTR